jgi:AraC-like DNA-binding protein
MVRRPALSSTFFTVTADDPDEARQIAADTLYPQRMDVLDPKSPLRMTMHGLRLGSVFVGDCTYETDVRIVCGDLVTSYHVNLPLSGHLLSRHRNELVDADPDTAAVYGPAGDTELVRWAGDCRQLCVKIDRGAFEQGLVQLLGDHLSVPLVVAPTLDVREGPGRSWARLVQVVAAEAAHADSVMHQPLVAPQLSEAIIFGLMTAIGHPYRGQFDDIGAGRPPVIARAVDYLHGHVADPISVADVAGHCGISVRSLQDGFQRHIGKSPSAYLRALRVRGVHDELVETSPELQTVAAIAHRWGFMHLGRFASLYRAEFDESPSQTLRRIY